MPKEKDPFWKYVTLNENNSKWRCNFCKQEYPGGATRIKAHLAGLGGFGIKGCQRVDVDVRAKAREVLVAKNLMDSDRGVSKERIPGNARAASTGTANPPNVEGGTNLQLPQGMPPSTQNRELMEEMGQEMRSAYIANPPFDGAMSNYSASPLPNSSFNELLTSLIESFDLEISNAQQNPGAPLTQNRELMEEMGQEMRAAYIANPPFDGAMSNYSALPPPNSPFNELRTSWIESFDLETSNAQQNPDAQLSNMATTSAPQHFSQPLQSGSQCGYGTGLVPPITSLHFHGPLIVESVPQTPGDINMIGLRTSEGEGTSCSAMASGEGVPYLLNPLHQPQRSIQSQMQMDDQQTPAGELSSQYDQLPTAGDSHCLEDRHQQSQLQSPMDIDPSILSQHAIDDLQALEVATNTTDLSSLRDMNRGSPFVDVRSICAKDEEIRNLKRKVKELDDKEIVIKEQMEIESAASSVRKKPRILVERWLKETERARNNFQIIGQANAETLPQKKKVETLTREAEELIKQMLPQPLLIEERDAKEDTFLERKLTGEAIHRNIELIWGHLKENHSRKIGIYGMGGVGKTTIMMHIHNRLLKDATFDGACSKKTFDGVIFITVSQEFSIYKLQSDIWKALKLGVMEDEDEKKRAVMLSKQLERKKNCVLILDDVWEGFDLEEVGIPIRADGFKLVLTTRSYHVCCQMCCQKEIKIEPLSQEEAESLFLEELGSKVAPNLEIEALVKSIVKECAGLPIGVITMARSMRGVTDVFEWRDSLVKLKESSMGQTDMEKVLMNLKFSYDRLGNPNFQQCFLSCALYPEDALITKFELVEFFIDQGLIDGLNTRREQYDRGLTILNKLGNVCLLEDHGGCIKMHDLIRDMALHIMSATCIVKARKFLRKIPPEEYWKDVLEKVSLMDNFNLELPLNMSPNCPKLSTLLLNGCWWMMNVAIPDSFFKNFLGLMVLNLSGNCITELPNSISNLVNLRALLLTECRTLRRIPYLGKVTSLRKLDTRGCRCLEAIEGLEKLVNLRYLDLTKTFIRRLPKGTLECLRNLQCLKVGAVNEEDITKLGALETFECYPKNIDDFKKCVRAIELGNNLHHCDLKVHLKMPGLTMQASDDAQFGNLRRSVNIMECDHAILSGGGECIFILIPKDVQIMRMSCCDGITNLSGMGSLKYLEEITMEVWENLEVLWGGHDEEVIDILVFPIPTPNPNPFWSLRVLKINRCPKLKYLFGHGSKSNLPYLREIKIGFCGKIVGIIAAVTSPPPCPLPFFPSLEEISVYNCYTMKRVVEYEWMPHFPNLRRITVFHCDNMEEIIGGPPPSVPVKEISLESLVVHHCNNMRKLLRHEWLLHLRNLRSIEVDHCKEMVEMISGAGQGQEGSIMTHVNNTPSSFQPSSISLPKLERLGIHFLPQLKSICQVPISCDSMKLLGVYGCPKLKGIPLQLQLRAIEELPRILVDDEEMLKTLMWDHPDAQAILQPYLRKGAYFIELSTKGKDL